MIGYLTAFIVFSILSGVALAILLLIYREKSQWTDIDIDRAEKEMTVSLTSQEDTYL